MAIPSHWISHGLGYNPSISPEAIRSAAAIHFDGNMKPWLDVALNQYKAPWTKYVDTEMEFLTLCNFGLWRDSRELLRNPLAHATFLLGQKSLERCTSGLICSRVVTCAGQQYSCRSGSLFVIVFVLSAKFAGLLCIENESLGGSCRWTFLYYWITSVSPVVSIRKIKGCWDQVGILFCWCFLALALLCTDLFWEYYWLLWGMMSMNTRNAVMHNNVVNHLSDAAFTETFHF